MAGKKLNHTSGRDRKVHTSSLQVEKGAFGLQRRGVLGDDVKVSREGATTKGWQGSYISGTRGSWTMEGTYELGEVVVEPLIGALTERVARKDDTPIERLESIRRTFEDADIRRGAAFVLGEIKDPRAIEPLLAALRDEDEEVRAEAGYALAEFGDVAIEPLLALMREEGVGEWAAYALARLGSSRVVEEMIRALTDEDAGVRKLAAYVLGDVGDKRAVEPLIGSLEDEDNEVRGHVVDALGSLKDRRAVEPLIGLLGDASPDIRMMAATSLGDIRDKRAVEPLIDALSDGDGGA